MEVVLNSRAVKLLRVSAAEAVEEGDTEALSEDIYEAFPEAAVEELESRLGAGDFSQLLTEILEDWSGDDIDELFELLETQLGDHGIDLKYESPDNDDDDYGEDDFGDLDDEPLDEPGLDGEL
jgi:hypothetical protein